ncbi:MAG: heavy metal-associated domain-containing protein [Candidatus Shapirobacteria bacterium]
MLNITGMHCTSCAKIIKMELNDHHGVIRAEVDDVKKQALIDIDPSQTDVSKLKKLINDLGYQAEEV